MWFAQTVRLECVVAQKSKTLVLSVVVFNLGCGVVCIGCQLWSILHIYDPFSLFFT